MKDPVVLTCINCMRRTKDWIESTRCNVHYDNGIYTFTCLVCGNEVLLKAVMLVKTKRLSKKQKKLLLEKHKIQSELGENNRINE